MRSCWVNHLINCSSIVHYFRTLRGLFRNHCPNSNPFQPKPSFDLSLKWRIDCFFDRAYDIVYISDRSGWSRAFVFPFLIWTSIPHSIHQEALLALVIWVIFFLKGQERTPKSILHYRNRPSPPLHRPTSSYRVRDLMLRSKK